MSHPHSLTLRLATPPFIWSPRYFSGSVFGFLRPGRWKPFSAGENRLQCDTGLSLDGQPGAALSCKVWFLNLNSSISEIRLCTPTHSTTVALMNLSTWFLMFTFLLDVTFMIIFLCKPFLLSAISLSPCQALGLPVFVGQLKSLLVACLLTFALECHNSQATAPVIWALPLA